MRWSLRKPVTSRYGELAQALDEQFGARPSREPRLVYRDLLELV